MKKVRVVIDVTEDVRREIKSLSGRKGLTITQLLLKGFHLFEQCADGCLERCLEEGGDKISPEVQDWAQKIIKKQEEV